MIIKSTTLAYLFDFDGTIVGSNQWKGLLSNSFDCFRRLHFNPSRLDIRWSILTGRPKVDRLFINLICGYHNLKPLDIFTSPTYFYHYKKQEEVYKVKELFIKSVLENKVKLSSYVKPVEKVLYIDNDLECTKYLNTYKMDYKYLAISVSDFIKKDFLELMSFT